MGYRDYQNGPRHSGGNRGQNGGRSRREPLRDHYYYEEPPRGWKEGDAFQDISSYSSPEKRRADQKAMEDQRRSAQRTSGRNAGKSGKNSQDIYSSSRPVRRKKGSIGKKIVAVLLVLVVVLAGSLVYMLSGLTMTSISKDSGSLGIQSGAFSDSRIVNIALFGLDAREDTDSGRSDVVMVLSVDKRHHTLKLTSILRDSEVAIEGYGYDKITHAYAYGGPELAIKSINQNFNLDIKNYVTVNFHQMAEIVDALSLIHI